jgi:hypothetical protein
MRGSYDGLLSRGRAGFKTVRKQSARNAHPDGIDGNADHRRTGQSNIAEKAPSGPAPLTNRAVVLWIACLDGCSDGRDVDPLPSANR